MKQINELIFQFTEHLKVLNRSPSTIRNYLMHLRAFVEATAEPDMRGVTRSMLEAYIAGLYAYRNHDGKPYAVATLCLKVRSVKRFFEFLSAANIIFIDPSETIKEPQKERRLVQKVLTPEDVAKILSRPNLGTLSGIRDRAILETLYSTGIRRGELCGLSIYDVDLAAKTLRINKGKGQKDRVVPLGKHAARFLQEYIAKVRPHHTRKNRGERRLFVNIQGKPLDKYTVGSIVKNHGKEAGIKKPVSPHMFRHAFAVALMKNGADITAVQKMLGHADLGTTQMYIRSLALDLKAVHGKTHPREKDKKAPQAIKPRIERKKSRHEPD
jgi:integrase/recombinase XerD